MQQIQEEYYKVPDPQGNHGAHPVDPNKSIQPPNLLPPTPQQGELEQIPAEMKKALEELSQTTIVDVEGGIFKKKEVQ